MFKIISLVKHAIGHIIMVQSEKNKIIEKNNYKNLKLKS